MMNMIYNKSDKGREEIATRKHCLDPKLRALLVMVDGKHSGHSLVRQFSYLGFNEQLVTDLLGMGFIQGTVQAASTVSPSAEREAETQQGKQADETAILDMGETQFQAVYNFFTHTIKSTLGLRGFLMQLKVERSSTIDDFRALRYPYLQAVLKAQGEEMAWSLGSRLDQLLNLGQPAAMANNG